MKENGKKDEINIKETGNKGVDNKEEKKEELKQQKNEEMAKRRQDKLDKKREKSVRAADPEVKARKKVIRTIVIIVVIVAIAGLVVYSRIKSASAGMPVTTVAAAKGTVQQKLSTSGTVQSNTTKTYFADVSLPIDKINVKAGDAVSSGDVLFTYDESQMADQIQIQKSTIAADAGNYSSSLYKNNQTIGHLNEADNNIPVIDQQINDAQAYIDLMNKKIADRQAVLAKKSTDIQKSINGIQNEESKSDLNGDTSGAHTQAKKDSMDTVTDLQNQLQDATYLQSNDKQIQQWKNEVSKYQDTITTLKSDQATMKSQQSTSKDAQLDGGSLTNLAQTEQVKKLTAKQTLDSLTKVQNGVKADFNGIVTDVKVVSGSTSAVGTAVLEEQSLDDVSVDLSVTKYDLDKIAKGEKAVVTIAGNDYNGEITRIDQMAVKNASGTPVIGATVTIKNPDGKIYLGVEAKVVVNCAEAKDVVTLPIECINTDQSGDFVYVVKNGVLTRKDVKVGISSDEDVVIKSGVSVGDQVVTGVTSAMTEGMKVTAMPQTADGITAGSSSAAAGN